MERDYEEFQKIVFESAKAAANRCDFSGSVQNSFKIMLEDGSATKEEIREHINVFLTQFYEVEAELSAVKTGILSVLDYYSK